MVNFFAVLENYSLFQPIRIGPMTYVGRNNRLWSVQAGGERYVLKQHTSGSYDDRASIDYEYQLLSRLAEQGLSFTLPVPQLTHTGNHLCETEWGLFSLARHLPGARLNLSELDQIEAFGAGLGEMHRALAACAIATRPGRPLFELLFEFPGPGCDVFSLMPHDLGLADEPGLRNLLAWWSDEAHALQAFAVDRYPVLPSQICHNDFTPANVLIESGRISAVLDFEFASPAARLFDVVMALRMALQIGEMAEPWPVVERFVTGYQRWIHLTTAEIEALPLMMRLRCAVLIVWWVARRQGLDRVPSSISNQQMMVQWLSHYEGPLLERVARAY